MQFKPFFVFRIGFAKNFVRKTPVQSTRINEPQLFPKHGLVADSIAMIPTNAFGYIKLDRVFVAGYMLGGTDLTAFLSDRGRWRRRRMRP